MMNRILLFLLVTPLWINAQSISVTPDDYNQEFLGTGASCGLYIGHFLSLSNENQNKASDMLYTDLQLNYIKDYEGNYPWDDPKNYDNFTKAYQKAIVRQPDLKVMICASNFPDHLENVDSDGKNIKSDYIETMPGIMDSIANYYFHICKGYQNRNIKVDYLELVNEEGYTEKITDLFDIAASKFKAMINDPAINTTAIPMPIIVGPSTWSAASPKKFIDGWKADRPNAWANCDIVSTHGYENGSYENYLSSYERCEGKLFFQTEQTAKLQRDESAGIDPVAEQFPDDGYNPENIGNIAIARHMIEFFNAGGNAFFAFLTNNPGGTNPALIGTSWGKNKVPIESTMYNGFKHLSATHPLGSKRLSTTLAEMDNLEAIAFRKEGENVAYVHFVNMHDKNESVTVDFQDAGIKSYEAWMTDSEDMGFDKVKNENFDASINKIVFNTTPYSVVTLKVELDTDGPDVVLQDQSITFAPIADKIENDEDITLSATASSGLEVDYKIMSGPASIDDGILKIEGIGKVSISASQAGNDTYREAATVIQEFAVMPAGDNVALNKTATASSQYNNNYPASNATDGNKTTNGGRWVSAKNDTFPQWIEIDLGETYNVAAFRFYNGSGGDYLKAPYEFKFQVYFNGTWITKDSQSLNRDATYLKAFSPFPTDRVRFYMPAAPEDYIARIYELEVYKEYEAPSGIDKTLGEQQLSLYPNPANHTFSILNAPENQEVSIINISGQKVLSTRTTENIDISQLSNGLYFVSLNGQFCGKLIKE